MNPAIITFSVLNYILAVLSLVGSAFCVVIIVAAGMSGDVEEDERIAGIVFYGFTAAFLLLLGIIYIVAGVGVMKRRPWGYYAHLVMSGITAFNCACCCLGILYTIPSFMICLQEDIRREFGLVPAETLPPVTRISSSQEEDI